MFLLLSFCCTTAIADSSVDTFADLKSCIANASDGDVIRISGTIEVTEKLTIDGNKAITISGGTITRSKNAENWYTGTLFNVTAGSTLTLDGGLLIDGGNEYAFDIDTYQSDLYGMNQITTENCAKYFALDPDKPIATQYMMTVAGSLNLNQVSIRNHYSTGSGIVNTSTGATVNLRGAQISHCASAQGNGVVTNASAANIAVNVYDGTVIDGCHVGGNHGLFKIYSGAVFTMYGGEIKNTTGWNSNGNVVGCYWGTVHLKGGTICSNSSVFGPNNGRNASIYLHSGAVFTMTDGMICHNLGRSFGGIDSPYDDSFRSISGGTIIDNVSVNGNPTPDLYASSTTLVTGGTFSQDVSAACADGYGCVPVNGRYVVGKAYGITYYLNGGTMDNAPVEYVVGYAYSLPDPVRVGYTFLGWTGANGSTPQKNLTVQMPGEGTVTYTANWKEIPKTFRITYNLNGGAMTGYPTEFTVGEPYVLPNPTREGYVFLGWTGGSIMSPQADLTVDNPTEGDITYTANWQKFSLPQTGDDSEPLHWLMMCILSASLLFVMRRKYQNS